MFIAIQAADTLATAKIDAVDKSKPPTIITIVKAHAIIARGAFWFNIFNKFLGVKNALLDKVKTIIKRTIKIRTA
jgi:hypothetical protein